MRLRVLLTMSLLAVIIGNTSGAFADTISRTTVNQADDKSGFQVHFIYVLPKGTVDRQWDTNGTISGWIIEAQTWLQKNLGRQISIDTFNGKPDISFLPSQYSLQELCRTCGTESKVAVEAYSQDSTLRKAKTLFFIFSETLGAGNCGWATRPGNTALSHGDPALSNCFSGATSAGISSKAQIIVHELFHSFGVRHTCINDSDLMIGTPECTIDRNTFRRVLTTLDKPRKNYIGGSASGVDLLTMPIWSDGTGSQANVQSNATSGNKYLPTLNDGTIYAVVGQISPPFEWDWDKNDPSSTTGFIDCLMVSNNQTINGSIDRTGCTFAVPSNWRVGASFTVTEKFSLGPFFGSVQVSGTLARADFTITPCTNYVCYQSGSYDLEFPVCFPSSTPKIFVQQIINGIWTTVGDAKLINNLCHSTDFPYSASYSTSFLDKGDYQFRWAYPTGAITTGSRNPIINVSVIGVQDSEPSKDQVAAAQLNGILLSTAADKAAADKAAADKAAADKAAAAKKKTTITCIKGKLTKKVAAVNPKCPSGYKKK